jgi:hypothetical protein
MGEIRSGYKILVVKYGMDVTVERSERRLQDNVNDNDNIRETELSMLTRFIWLRTDSSGGYLRTRG